MARLTATILMLSAFAASGCNPEPETSTVESTPAESSAVASSAPLSITLDNEGRFGSGWSWTLTVNSDRSAALEIRTFPDAKTRTFSITSEQMAGLRTTLETERFFGLADEYGELVADGSTQTITVQSGDKIKTVKLNYLMNWVHHDPAKLTDPARAVRIWRHVRQWFDDDDAVDLGRYDQMVLDAVPTR